MFDQPITLGDLANLIGLAGMIVAGALFVQRLGGKLDRLSIALDAFRDVFARFERSTEATLRDHEERIREGGH